MNDLAKPDMKHGVPPSLRRTGLVQRFTLIRIGRGVAQQVPVRCLLTTPEGDLWVGTDAALARIPSAALGHFDRVLVTLYHVGVGQNDQISCVHWSRAGTLWVETSAALYRFDRGGRRRAGRRRLNWRKYNGS